MPQLCGAPPCRFLKAEDVGFSAEPAVSAPMAVAPNGCAAVVIASDGLWDVMSCERAAQVGVLVMK